MDSTASQPNGGQAPRRRYLMLQGLATPFFRALAHELTIDTAADDDSSLLKVNYCGGDWWFSPAQKGAVSICRFNGKPQTLPDFYETLIKANDITDIILFGDCRPIHKQASKQAKKYGITVWVFEEGYTRPGFITLEEGGTNALSPLPGYPEAIRERAAALPTGNTAAGNTSLPNPMPARVRMDLAHHFWNILLRPLYFRYKTHRPAKVRDELRGWINRVRRSRRYRTENDALIKLFETAEKPYFFVPLQLNSDYQIREHSPYEGTLDFIQEVVASFAKNAPADTHLMFKNHPLDNGMIDYRNYIAMAGIRHGVADRLSFLEGGDLGKFLAESKGIILINSTVGYTALKQAKPMKVMGRALYDMEGLTDQGPLDTFWKKPKSPDPAFIEDFLKVVRTDSQIAGDFFTPTGINMAAKAASVRIKAGTAHTNTAPAPVKTKKVEEINA